jgi:cold shock CspA family protein
MSNYMRRRRMAWFRNFFSKDGYGFIETFDGREIYFHKNSSSKMPSRNLPLEAKFISSNRKARRGPKPVPSDFSRRVDLKELNE